MRYHGTPVRLFGERNDSPIKAVGLRQGTKVCCTAIPENHGWITSMVEAYRESSERAVPGGLATFSTRLETQTRSQEGVFFLWAKEGVPGKDSRVNRHQLKTAGEEGIPCDS